MWLINVSVSWKVSFIVKAFEPSISILSHTWLNSEATMQQHQDITADGNKRHNRVKATEGYAKIEASCMQALRAGLPYIWIDTCCIDKSSSADLSEAINSMFHWYRISSICLVYLDDIEAPSLHEEGQRPLTEVKALLGRARWFTRGWTLQELIASQSIRFFDKDWTFLGTKGSLMTSLVDITGIDQVYLGGADLNNASIAMRMSWAARRVTTKIEDVAHSLFGIFNVNMPLLYGEGSKAFQRLQEEILKESDDQSLFAWQTHGANHKFLPDTLPIMLIHMGISVFAQHLNDFLQTADTISYAPSGEASMVGGKGLKIELPYSAWKRAGRIESSFWPVPVSKGIIVAQQALQASSFRNYVLAISCAILSLHSYESSREPSGMPIHSRFTSASSSP